MHAYQLEAPPLRIWILLSAARAVLYCAGEIDLANIHHFEEALRACIHGADADVEVDLRGVRYLDSCTLDALDRAGCRLRLDGRRLKVSAGERLARLFRLTGLGHHLVPFHPSTIRSGAAGHPSHDTVPGDDFAVVRPENGMPLPRARVARRVPHTVVEHALRRPSSRERPAARPESPSARRLLRYVAWDSACLRNAGVMIGWHQPRRIH